MPTRLVHGEEALVDPVADLAAVAEAPADSLPGGPRFGTCWAGSVIVSRTDSAEAVRADPVADLAAAADRTCQAAAAT